MLLSHRIFGLSALVAFAAGCAAPELPPEVSPFEAVGDSVAPGGRTEDLELAPGPDLEVQESKAASIEEYEAEAGITGNELEEALAAEAAEAAGTQPKSIFGGIGKAFSLVTPRIIPNTVLAGGFMRLPSGLPSLLGGKNLYLSLAVLGAKVDEARGQYPTVLAGQSCTLAGANRQAVPTGDAAKLVAKFGGTPASYRLCVANTYVYAGSATKVSVRVYFDTRVTPAKRVATRTVFDLGGKTMVANMPFGIF